MCRRSCAKGYLLRKLIPKENPSKMPKRLLRDWLGTQSRFRALSEIPGAQCSGCSLLCWEVFHAFTAAGAGFGIDSADVVTSIGFEYLQLQRNIAVFACEFAVRHDFPF